jgi:hypothetical protein
MNYAKKLDGKMRQHQRQLKSHPDWALEDPSTRHLGPQSPNLALAKANSKEFP